MVVGKNIWGKDWRAECLLPRQLAWSGSSLSAGLQTSLCKKWLFPIWRLIWIDYSRYRKEKVEMFFLCWWLIICVFQTCSLGKFNTNQISLWWVLIALGMNRWTSYFKNCGKNRWCEIYPLNPFLSIQSILLTINTILYSISLELTLSHNWNYTHWITYSSPLSPAPASHHGTYCFYESDLFRFHINGILQYLSFCDSHISLSIMFSVF